MSVPCPPTTPVPCPRSGRALPPTYEYEKFLNLMIFGRTNLRMSLSGAKFDEEADFDVHSAVGPPKPHQIHEKMILQSANSAEKNF